RPTLQLAASVSEDSPQARVLALVNAARADHGLAPLADNAALTRAAQSYAETMASTDCFSHSCGPVPDMVQRAEQAGYSPWTALGENIAAGYRTPEEVVAAWLESPGHRANILNDNFRDSGVGVAYGGRYGIYWVHEFGAQ
ncbi:MAG: CAP domain-containing protein, partial [Chloroflexota bacterium]